MRTANHSRALNPAWGFWKATQENTETKPLLHTCTCGSLAFWILGESREEKDAFHLCNLPPQSS